MLVLNGIEEIKAKVGEDLGTSDWIQIDQDAVNAFAEVTGDDQWIHVDPERAAATPLGGTIVHGFFTLSLIPKFAYETYTVEGVSFAMNYGSDKVRFLSPVPTGSRLRMNSVLSSVEEKGGGVLMKVTCTIEIEGSEKPACIAEMLTIVFG
ncbi:MAG: MaoC family dehydratase [Solirubrobacterales bacterium]|nr:MaoC family dehydratase [Solirubrobacterales bacterium]